MLLCQCAPRLLGVVVLLLWCYGVSCFTPSTVDGRLVVPDIARVDNALLKMAEADKFLSLWFIHVLKDPVYTSSERWTLLVPKNSGVGGAAGGGQELLNHAVLGHVINPASPPTPPPVTLAGTPLLFTSDQDGTLVNGVRLTGEEYKFSDGVVYIIESALPILSVPEASTVPESTVLEPQPQQPTTTRVPPLTHRFATFKPRVKDEPRRPSPALASRPARPARPVLQPVLGEEPLTLAEAAGIQSEFPGEALAGSGFGAPMEESEDLATPVVKDNLPFLKSFLEYMEGAETNDGAEFLHHFRNANISHRFRDTGRYTALVPSDVAFYSYYPIDWGFNPFLVENFTKDVLMNHFVRGNINLADLPSLAELTTLGGKTIKFSRRGGKLLGNGVEVVLETEHSLSRGRAYALTQLLFVDNDRVFELQAQYGDLETAPLLGNPWPASQFLSHLLGWLEEEPRTSYFAEYLNLTNLAYLVPGHDDNLDPLKYTALIPTDKAISETLYADAPDPFILDAQLREQLVLSHLIPGRLYQADLTPGATLTTLANTTLTVTAHPDGGVSVGGGRVVGQQEFLYNLANVFLVDHILGITDEDILAAINKYPTESFLGEPQEGKSSTQKPIINNPKPTRPPPTTMTTTAFTLPDRTITSTLQPLTFRPRPTTTPTPSTTTTTPRIRFETRTEISISRRVNDGVLEPLDNSS